MNNNRPRGREKNVTGPGKTVNKRGEGLHTGPVGDSGGYSDRREPSGGSGQRGTRSGGGMKLLILPRSTLFPYTTLFRSWVRC